MAHTRLKTLRQESGLSQEELSKRTNISRATIGKCESGQGTTRMKTRRILARAIGGELGWDEADMEHEARHLADWQEAPAVDPRTPVSKASDELVNRIADKLESREIERDAESSRKAAQGLHRGYRRVTDPQATLQNLDILAKMARVATFGSSPGCPWQTTYTPEQNQLADFSSMADHIGVSERIIANTLADADLLISDGKMPRNAVAIILRHFDDEDPGFVESLRHTYDEDDRPTAVVARTWIRHIRKVSWDLWQDYNPGTMPTPEHSEARFAEAEGPRTKMTEPGSDRPPTIRRRLHPSDGTWTSTYLDAFDFESYESAVLLSSLQMQRLGPAANNTVLSYDRDCAGNAAALIEDPLRKDHRAVEILWPAGRADEVSLAPGDQIVAETNPGDLFVALIRDDEIVDLIPKSVSLEGDLGSASSTFAPAQDISAVLEANGIRVALESVQEALMADTQSVTINVDDLNRAGAQEARGAGNDPFSGAGHG